MNDSKRRIPRCPGRDSNRTPREYKSQALLFQQTVFPGGGVRVQAGYNLLTYVRS
jgi:hypothetical protein